MIENAKSQIVLVLLLVAASIVSLVFKDIKLGLDLAGGTELIYMIDKKQAEKDLGEETDWATFMNTTVGIIRDRIDPQGTLDAQVLRRGEDGIYIALPDVSKQQAEEIEAKITRLGTLRMQVCAYDKHPKTKVQQYDLAKEKERLETWIKKDDNKKDLLEDPLRIELFHQLSEEEGGRISDKLHWVPHKITKELGASKKFDRSFANFQNELSPNVVKVYEDAELQKGLTDEEAALPARKQKFLLEYVPIDFGEQGFSGEDLDANQVHPSVDNDGQPVVRYEIKDEKKDAYERVSDDYTGFQSAIILDGYIKSAPRYLGAIPGRGQIQGFTQPEAVALADVLKRGSLKVKPIKQSNITIGATLGQASIRRGQISLIVGAGIVLMFILYYYRRAGVVATVGILLNVGFVFGAVSFIGATLTLPGLGGLVLTIGMAVDANILIYERIREEIKHGKDLAMAVRHGFERAIVTILDANVTTFIAGLVLYNAGVGPIRGFAVTLMIGIATSLFTAFFVSRLIFHYMLERKMDSLPMVEWFAGLRMNFLRFSKPAMVCSGFVIVAGLVAYFSVPDHDKLALDFTGGADVRVVTNRPMTAQQVLGKLDSLTDFHPQVTTVFDAVDDTAAGGDAERTGTATKFSIKLKITDKLAAKYAEDEKRVEAAGEIYQRPYVSLITQAMAGLLVPEALTTAVFDGKDIPPIVPGDRENIATLVIHSSTPVKVADVKQILSESLGANKDEIQVGVVADDTGKVDEAATIGTNLRLSFDVNKKIDTKKALFSYVTDILSTNRQEHSGEADHPVLNLSNPIPDVAEIGGRMVGELQTAAFEAMLIALFCIVMYIRVRFHEYKYGLAAVCALVHDVLIALGLVVFFNWSGLVNCELSLSMIAAFLTIIGYSINDTIVIFDRVRENLANQAKFGDTSKSFADTINISINQTLARTILTSCTTFFVVATLFVVNYGSGSELEGFAFAMIIGIITGTYSTIFIASPIVMWLRSREKEDAGLSEDGGLSELAAEETQDQAIPATTT